MRDLTAQATSSLLPFPRVTIDALGEDEITLDSVLHGRFTVGKLNVLFYYQDFLEISIFLYLVTDTGAAVSYPFSFGFKDAVASPGWPVVPIWRWSMR